MESGSLIGTRFYDAAVVRLCWRPCPADFTGICTGTRHHHRIEIWLGFSIPPLFRASRFSPVFSEIWALFDRVLYRDQYWTTDRSPLLRREADQVCLSLTWQCVYIVPFPTKSFDAKCVAPHVQNWPTWESTRRLEHAAHLVHFGGRSAKRN